MKRLMTAGLALVACGGDPVAPSGEFRGVARIELEAWSFQPCGSRERWNINVDAVEKGAIENFELASRLMFDQPECLRDAGVPGTECAVWRSTTTYLRVVGALKGPGMYGHLSAHTFDLTFLRILEASADVPTTCARP
jgi:hypothetical protein